MFSLFYDIRGQKSCDINIEQWERPDLLIISTLFSDAVVQ